MKFMVTIADAVGQRLEARDDTVLRLRLEEIIRRELRRYHAEHLPVASVKVVEVPDLKGRKS